MGQLFENKKLSESDIRDTEAPLSQFLRADTKTQKAISDYFDAHRDERLFRVRAMLSCADKSELKKLTEALRHLKADDSVFLRCLKRGIPVKSMILGLPDSDTPHLDILSIGMDQLREFASLFNEFDSKAALPIANKIMEKLETLEDASIFKRDLGTLQHSLQTGKSAFIKAIDTAFFKRQKQEMKTLKQHSFSFHSAPAASVEKDEIKTTAPTP